MPRKTNAQKLARSISDKLSAEGNPMSYNKVYGLVLSAYSDVRSTDKPARVVEVQEPCVENVGLVEAAWRAALALLREEGQIPYDVLVSRHSEYLTDARYSGEQVARHLLKRLQQAGLVASSGLRNGVLEVSRSADTAKFIGAQKEWDVLELLAKRGPTPRAELNKALRQLWDCSRETARNYLDMLINAGVVVRDPDGAMRLS